MDKVDQRIIRVSEVVKRTGLSKSSVYARIRGGDFPKQVPLGKGRAVGFLSHEVDAWFSGLEQRQDGDPTTAEAALAIAYAQCRSYLRFLPAKLVEQGRQNEGGR